MGISNTSRQKNLTGSEKENIPIKFQLNFFGLLKIIDFASTQISITSQIFDFMS